MKFILSAAIWLLAINAKASGPETLMGYVHDEQGITVQVFSGGCTRKEDFYVQKEIVKNRIVLTFFRKFPDTCLALIRYGEKITFSYGELDLGFQPRFKIKNPVDASVGGFRQAP